MAEIEIASGGDGINMKEREVDDTNRHQAEQQKVESGTSTGRKTSGQRQETCLQLRQLRDGAQDLCGIQVHIWSRTYVAPPRCFRH